VLTIHEGAQPSREESSLLAPTPTQMQTPTRRVAVHATPPEYPPVVSEAEET
jgi:hypothetical protein